MPEGSLSATHDVPMGEESPRLSTASVGSNERSSTATLSDCGEVGGSVSGGSSSGGGGSGGQRPVSLVSTLSSGSSGSSRDDSPPCSTGGGGGGGEGGGGGGRPPDVDLDLCPHQDLSPARQPPLSNHSPDAAGATEEGGEEEERGGGPRGGGGGGGEEETDDASQQQTPLSPFAAKAMAPNPKLTYLDRVVMEIIETERMYVRDLRSIVEDYLAQIIDTGDLPIRPEQVCALFGNIEDIYEFNSDLLQSLEMCDNDPVAIARCFVLKSEYFKIYTQYCTNYPNSVAALIDCMRNKSLAKFFRERQAALKRSLALGSYLLKPVQRILKYHLLLQEIAKHFDPDEEGYEVVEEAIFTMTGVAWYINDMMRNHEHAVRLQEVQSLLINWKGPDLTTYGELVLEGTFRVHRAKNERTLFLLDRILLITKRRGQHYVYKTHISCSTLMLIESAKDSLCFSVTHYKHPKQPHTVQAKTVEERKLWAHHIKRLILENHQAIIPQKAKEAIMEMDSLYPQYRYSPERLRNAASYQSEDFPSGRQGRRQSEPTKQILRSTKAILKHADSEGALPASMARPVQPAASISTLGSSIGESEAERPSMEEYEDEEEEEEEGEEEQEQEEEEDSLERLSPSSDSEEPVSRATTSHSPLTSPSSSTTLTSRRRGISRCEATEEQEQEVLEEVFEDDGGDPDEIVMEDNQVEDFASSMLEAISCWHNRARALLSLGGTTDDEEQVKVENGQLEGQEEEEKEATEEPSTPEEATEVVLKTENLCVPSSVPEKPAHEPSVQPVSPPKLPDNSESAQDVPNHTTDTSEPTESVKEPVSKQEDSSTHSSEEEVGVDEEEDEDEEEEQSAESAETSILPSSVLDQASTIAEHFVSSTRRSSSTMDDVRSQGCPSPRVPSRTGSTLSLGGGDNHEWGQRVNNHCSEETDDPMAHEVFTPADVAMLPDVFDNTFRRRDSTLSKRDQLLIDKIKCYYESADYVDGDFNIKRRESLSYIPTGFVRSSVTKLNSNNPNEGTEKKRSSSVSVAPDVPQSLYSESRERLTSTETLEFCSRKASETSEHGSDVSLDSFRDQTKCPSQRNASISEDEFLPSSEMIKVWQQMEKDINRPQDEGRAIPRRRDAHRIRVASPNMSRKSPLSLRTTPEPDSPEPLMILEESDLSTITEEATSPSPFRDHRGVVLGRSASLTDCLRPREVDGRVRRAPVPRVIQLRAEEMEIQPLKNEAEGDDSDASQSKVFHLARKYSQRIKCTKPMVQLRNQDVGQEGMLGKRSLLCVLEEKPKEEKRERGKPCMSLSLDLSNMANHQEVFSREQTCSPSPCSSVTSPRVLSPSRPPSSSKSPLSPTPHVEGFFWPDVRELRSKYTHLDRTAAGSQTPAVARSRSVPEKMQESGPYRRSSCSSNMALSEAVAVICRSLPTREMEGRHHRTGSLDQKLSRMHLNKLQDMRRRAPTTMTGSSSSSRAPTTMTSSSSSSSNNKAPANNISSRKAPSTSRTTTPTTYSTNRTPTPTTYSTNRTPTPTTYNTNTNTRTPTPTTYSSNSKAPTTTTTTKTIKASTINTTCNSSKSAGYYVAGETNLSNDKKLIVVEKVGLEPVAIERESPKRASLSSSSQVTTELPWLTKEKETEREREDTDDSYVQIRSPTSREKISIMAVIDRCRAYQESDEYRQREESAAKAEQHQQQQQHHQQQQQQPANTTHRSRKGKDSSDKTVASREQLDEALKAALDSTRRPDSSQQGVVKNLRERFLNQR